MSKELPMQLTEREVLEYLDKCIEHWRDRREGKDNSSVQLSNVAPYYIDAFQSVRMSLFGELKD